MFFSVCLLTFFFHFMPSSIAFVFHLIIIILGLVLLVLYHILSYFHLLIPLYLFSFFTFSLLSILLSSSHVRHTELHLKTAIRKEDILTIFRSLVALCWSLLAISCSLLCVWSWVLVAAVGIKAVTAAQWASLSTAAVQATAAMTLRLNG